MEESAAYICTHTHTQRKGGFSLLVVILRCDDSNLHWAGVSQQHSQIQQNSCF